MINIQEKTRQMLASYFFMVDKLNAWTVLNNAYIIYVVKVI